MRLRLSVVIGAQWSVLLLGTPATPRTLVGQSNDSPHAIRPPTPDTVTAFVDVTVVPMDTDRVLAGQTVVVRGGRIAALGPAASVPVPAGAVKVDGRGKYLMPGLADMHAHLHQAHSLHDETSITNATGEAFIEQRLLYWLADGVTTIRDMDYNTKGPAPLELRARVVSGAVLGPRMYMSGVWGISGGNGGPWPALSEIGKYVAAYKAAGYDFVKSYYEPPDVFDSVVAATRRVGLPIAGHVTPGTSLDHALESMKSIEHPITSYDPSLTQKLAPAAGWDTSLVMPDPTSTVSLAHPDTARIRAVVAKMRRYGVWNCPTQGHYDLRHNYPVANGIIKAMQDAGVGLLVGTDEFNLPGGVARDLQALVAEGLTTYQALLAATRNVAVYFGTLQDAGTIATGKWADMVLLPGNPLADVGVTAHPVGVMIGGRWLTEEELQRRLASYVPKAQP